MAALTFFSYFFLGIGPSLAFFTCFIAQKSFLTLLTFFSCFLWLVVLLITAAIYKAFLPFKETVGTYAGVLTGAVVIQELVRVGVWFLHKKSMSMLEDVAREKGHRFILLDKLYVALAWGFGHSTCHIIFFFLSFISLTTGSGTYYLDSCPQMSLFLMGALYSIAFSMVLSSITVISFEGFHTHNWLHVLCAPMVHYAVAMLTLLNIRQDGCMIAMPVNLAIGVVCVVYAGQVAWRKGVEDMQGLGREVLLPHSQGGGVGEGGEMQPMERQGSASGEPAVGLRTRRGAAPEDG